MRLKRDPPVVGWALQSSALNAQDIQCMYASVHACADCSLDTRWHIKRGKRMITVSLNRFMHNCCVHNCCTICTHVINGPTQKVSLIHATSLRWQHCHTITIRSKLLMPYLQRFSRSSSGRRVMNMPCSAARRGYKRRMTSPGVVPELYALFISLKPNEKAVMMSLVLRAPFRKLCLPRPTACRMLSAILACSQMH